MSFTWYVGCSSISALFKQRLPLFKLSVWRSQYIIIFFNFTFVEIISDFPDSRNDHCKITIVKVTNYMARHNTSLEPGSLKCAEEMLKELQEKDFF